MQQIIRVCFCHHFCKNQAKCRQKHQIFNIDDGFYPSQKIVRPYRAKTWIVTKIVTLFYQ